MKLLFTLLMAAATAQAGTVNFALTNFTSAPLPSNTVIQLFYTNQPTISGLWITTGKPIRINAPYGVVSTNLQPGDYSMTVEGITWASPLRFSVGTNAIYNLSEIATNASVVTSTGPFVLGITNTDGTVTITPSNGKGIVTISATGGGGSTNGVTALQATNIAVSIAGDTNTALQSVISAASNAAYSTAVSTAKTNSGRRIYNVQTYGAVGDGVANDTAAILAAYSDWTNSSAGGVLYFPAGRYLDANAYRLNYNAIVNHPGNPEARRWIRGDGSGCTFWVSTGSARDFIQVSGIPLSMVGICLENDNPSQAENRRGVVAVDDSGTFYTSDVALVGWNVGLDGAAGAGGKMFGLSVYNCGVGLRVSGYCDAWFVTMNARRCWKAGLEIGGTNHFISTSANGGFFHVMGEANNIGVIVGEGKNNTITGYMEKQTNGMVCIGHPPEFGEGSEDGSIHGVRVQLSGVPQSGEPGVVLYAKATSISFDNCTSIAGNGRYEVESVTAAADSTPMKFENHNGLNFKPSTGDAIRISGRTTRLNWTEHVIGDYYAPFQAVWGNNATTNATRTVGLGLIPWNMDDYRPNTIFWGRVDGANAATANFGGGASAGKPFSAIKFWLGDAGTSGTGSNVFLIAPNGLFGNGYGITNQVPLLNTNAASSAFNLTHDLQFIDRSSSLTISGFGGKWTGYGNVGRLLVRNSSAGSINVTWPAGTFVVNVSDGATNNATALTSGLIGMWAYTYYPDVITNVLYYPPGWSQSDWTAISTNIITDLRQEIADTTLPANSLALTNISVDGGDTSRLRPLRDGAIWGDGYLDYVDTGGFWRFGQSLSAPSLSVGDLTVTNGIAATILTGTIDIARLPSASLTWTNISADGGDTVRMQPILAGTVADGSIDYIDTAGEWRFNQGLRVPSLSAGSLTVTNGFSATNLTSGTIDAARLPVFTATNSIVGGISVSNQTAIYLLSITENTTLSAFGNMHASEFRTASMWITNGAGSTYTLTLPAGTSCPDGTTLYCTNGQRRVVSVGGIINFTNAISRGLP